MGKRNANAASSGKRAAKKPATKKNTGAWWEEAEEVPRAGLPDARALNKRAKRLRRFVWASVMLCPLALFATFIAMTTTSSASTPTIVVDRYATTKATAIVAVRRWLGTSPSPLPGGTLVGWDSATSKKSPLDPQNPQDRYSVEVHHLTVASANGSLFDTTVSLAVAPSIGTVVIGQPTLIPRAPSDDSFSETPWPGLAPATTSDSVETAVLAWADAYDSGDPDSLRLDIGDTNASHSYMPLVGATLLDGSVEDAAAAPGAPTNANGDPTSVVVQASFQIRWAGQTLGENETDFSTVTYDLLVEKADTAAPVVVAWGGAGTGPYLKAYATNAVTGRAVEAPTPETMPKDQNPATKKGHQK